MTETKKDILERADVINLVDTFYRKVIRDETIGVFFTQVVALDWDHHIPKMYDFWETVLLNKASYKGNTMKAHVDLNQKKNLENAHFDRWLELFYATCDELFEGENTENAKTRALSIATMIRVKLANT